MKKVLEDWERLLDEIDKDGEKENDREIMYKVCKANNKTLHLECFFIPLGNGEF